MGFSKLHSSLVNSSLWSEPDHVRLLFITLLSMADRDGCVYGSRPGIERVAMLDIEACRELDPWVILMEPDRHSSDRMRAPENEGRRIEEIPGGFRLLNHAYYRGLRNDDDRAQQNREAQARFRAKNKPASAMESRDQPPKAHAEAEAEALNTSSSPPAPRADVEEVVAHYVARRPKRRPGSKERSLIRARLAPPDSFTVDQLKGAIDGCLKNPFTNEQGKVFDSLELIVRNSAKVNQYLATLEAPPKKELAPYGQGVSRSELGGSKSYSPWGS